MFLSIKPLNIKCISRLVRLYSIYKKSHYEVLNLRKNCTDKEIKDAYIRMTKEYHPDKNKDTRAQEKFVRIVEAYNVLSKPSSRARYDSMSEIPTGPSSYASSVHRTHMNYRSNTSYGYYYEPPRQTNTSSSNFYANNTKSNNNNNDWYYGFKGINKLPNMHIILICLGVVTFGVILQLYVVRTMYVIHRGQAQEKSKFLAEEYQKVRDTAIANGNEMQTRLILEKIVTAANPTVTTASLGQALADEKKEHAENLLTEFGVADSPDSWYDENIRHSLKDYNVKLLFETW